jgi:cysteinyl-tRNA synthetase
MLRVHNTLTGKLEVFEPSEPGHVRLYACGPTVWNFAHIGNFRTFIFYDVLRRYLRFKGYRVTHVENVTDVDDRIIEQTIQQGKSLPELTQPYLEAFLEDMATLNIQKPDVMPRATEHIEEMVQIVEALRDKGFAYETDGSIYFRVAAFADYGKLSGKKLEGNIAGGGGRVEAGEYAKQDERDFVLWKVPKQAGEASWETRIGTGRPGWHLECSAMAMKYLGKTFDIHLGGVDLVFPHHENEIAQSEAATGQTFSRYWMHSEHLRIDDEVMSKSKGNFFTLRDILAEGYAPAAIRYLLLSVPYRTQLNFTFDGLKAATSALDRLRNLKRRLDGYQPADGEAGAGSRAAEQALADFEAAMDDDLNTSAALAALFTMVGTVNQQIDDGTLTTADRAAISSALDRIDSVFGVIAGDEESIPQDILKLVEQRNQARIARDFARADAIRSQLQEMGFVLEDTPQGTKARRK